MPQAALRLAPVDLVLPLGEIGAHLARLAPRAGQKQGEAWRRS
jgi:chemotaxis response regulator CheB